MKQLPCTIIIVIVLMCSHTLFAQNVVYNDVRFDSTKLIVTISITDVKTYDILEALKRGLEGRIEYVVEIVENPVLPLLPKNVIKTITVKKKVKFDFFKKAYIVSRSHVPTLYYSDESIIEELFNNQQIVIDNAYALRKSKYSIRIRVSFSSVKLYFPLNLIFNYIVGIWDFDTDWKYGPKLVGIPYAE